MYILFLWEVSSNTWNVARSKNLIYSNKLLGCNRQICHKRVAIPSLTKMCILYKQLTSTCTVKKNAFEVIFPIYFSYESKSNILNPQEIYKYVFLKRLDIEIKSISSYVSSITISWGHKDEREMRIKMFASTSTIHLFRHRRTERSVLICWLIQPHFQIKSDCSI